MLSPTVARPDEAMTTYVLLVHDAETSSGQWIVTRNGTGSDGIVLGYLASGLERWYWIFTRVGDDEEISFP